MNATLIEDVVEECAACGDTGFERFECTGDQTCGRWRRHAPHTYCLPCPCRPINRTFQEKVARLRPRSESC